MSEKEQIDIETLAKDFEERITNNEFYEDVSLSFRGKDVLCRIRPIPQRQFNKIIGNKKLQNTEELMNFNIDIVAYGLLNKYDNKPFDKDKILDIFPVGLIALISERILFISGLIDESRNKEMELFLKPNA